MNSAEHFYLYRKSIILEPLMVVGGEISETRTDPMRVLEVDVGPKDMRRTGSLCCPTVFPLL